MNGSKAIDRATVLKQRRLLLTFTFLLAAVHLLDVKLSGSANVQGLVATFKHPWAIVVALWLAWAWSWWRYWQHEHVHRRSAVMNDLVAQARPLVQKAISAAIKQAAASGLYADRGVDPDDKVWGSGTDAHGSGPDINWDDREWEFPNVQVHHAKPGEQQGKLLQGGANCTLDTREVRRIKRTARRSVLIADTNFADWKVPYFLLWLAPAAALVDLARRFDLVGRVQSLFSC